MFSLLIGAIAAPVSFWAVRLLKRSGVDDRLECLACHGLAGALGIVLTGLFAQRSEDSPTDGAVFGNPALLGIQFAGVGVTLVTCVIGTTASYWIVWVVARVFRLNLRVDAHDEGRIDESQHREQAYHHDVGGNNRYGGYKAGGGDGGSQADTEDMGTALLLAADAAVVGAELFQSGSGRQGRASLGLLDGRSPGVTLQG